MALSFAGKLRPLSCSVTLFRNFRSDAALEALANASEAKIPNLVLYNYPSFSGAFSALFAHLYHSGLNLPYLILPFSSVAPFRHACFFGVLPGSYFDVHALHSCYKIWFRTVTCLMVNDVCTEGLRTCYFLDFLGPRGFASELSKRTSCKIIGFDHRKLSLSKIISKEEFDDNLTFLVNLEKSSSVAVYEYFSSKLSAIGSVDGHTMRMLNPKDAERTEMVLKYIEDGDLRRWVLPDSKAFNIGICQWRSKLNCITNPHMYEQGKDNMYLLVVRVTGTLLTKTAHDSGIMLMEMSSVDLMAGGNCYMSTRQTAANKLLTNVFKVRLGRGFYGECLGVKADGSSDLVDEIGKELSRKSAAAGLRPIGAVIYMQRKNLKMCLRSIDSCTDTSEVAKAYGGGGSPSSSSFIIRMDEYNKWISLC